MRFAILACLAAIVLAGSTRGIAQPPAGPPDRGGPQILGRLDTDRDGFVSKLEFDGPDSMFDRLDTDQDGQLSADELRGVRERDIMFAKADVNSDQKVSLEEFLNYQRKMFSELDKDDDELLSSDEFAAGLGRGGRQGMWGPGGMGQRGQFGGPGGMGQMMLQRMDTDGDGKLSPDEWRGPEESFANADKNSDGFIDSDELSEMGPRGGMGGFGGMRRRGDGQGGGGFGPPR